MYYVCAAVQRTCCWWPSSPGTRTARSRPPPDGENDDDDDDDGDDGDDDGGDDDDDDGDDVDDDKMKRARGITIRRGDSDEREREVMSYMHRLALTCLVTSTNSEISSSKLDSSSAFCWSGELAWSSMIFSCAACTVVIRAVTWTVTWGSRSGA